MSYLTTIILYYLNLIALIISLGGIIYSVAMFFIRSNEQSKWLITGIIFLLTFILLIVLFVIRRSKIPAAGRDYL